MSIVFNININGENNSFLEHNNSTSNLAIGSNFNSVSNANSAQVSANRGKSYAIAAAVMVGQQAIRYTTSNIGKWTGNSRSQKSFNNMQEVIGLGVMAYTNPYLAIATVGVKMATTMVDSIFDAKWDNIRTNANAKRAGYSSYNELVGRKR